MKKIVKKWGGSKTLGIIFFKDERKAYDIEAGDIVDISIENIEKRGEKDA